MEIKSKISISSKRSKKSKIWTYFETVENDEDKKLIQNVKNHNCGEKLRKIYLFC